MYIINSKAFLLFTFILLSGQILYAGEKYPPNIIIILTDDQGWGDIANHGNRLINTPNLDHLQENSTEFNRFYVSPVCAPSRASLLTGKYHLATGVTWVTNRNEVMRAEEITIAEILKANGYRTGCFGKWHNGTQYPTDPNGQGFDTFIGFKGGHLNNYFNTSLDYNQEKIATKGYITDVLTDSAIEFIKDESPFFCYLAYNAPHAPFQVPDKYFRKYKNKGLDDKTASVYGMVENMDHNIGRLLKALKWLDKENETIVIFLSDNGPNNERFNGGFKGLKGTVDEGGVRVPFYIRYPKIGIDKPVKVKTSGAHIDILPTILELTGIKKPASLNIEGKSLVPLLKGDIKNWPDRYIFTHQVHRKFNDIPGAVRSNRYLLTILNADTIFYDLIKDPFEKNDVSADFPELKRNFIQSYQNWFLGATQKGILPPPIQVGFPAIKEIDFPAPDGHLYGDVAFAFKDGWANDWFVNMGSEKDSVVWDINAIKSASYMVQCELSIDKKYKTDVELTVELGNRKKSILLKQSYLAPLVYSPDRAKRGGAYERSWPVVSIGNLEIPNGMHTLKIYLHNPEGEDVAIKSIKLIINKLKND